MFIPVQEAYNITEVTFTNQSTTPYNKHICINYLQEHMSLYNHVYGSKVKAFLQISYLDKFHCGRCTWWCQTYDEWHVVMLKNYGGFSKLKYIYSTIVLLKGYEMYMYLLYNIMFFSGYILEFTKCRSRKRNDRKYYRCVRKKKDQSPWSQGKGSSFWMRVRSES